MITSLSAATRDNTITAELSVASTKGHHKWKAEEDENEEPVPKKGSRILHKSSVEFVVQNERKRTEETAPKKFETLIQRTTNPREPKLLKTSADLKRMTFHCLIRRKQGSFRKSELDKVDDGSMIP